MILALAVLVSACGGASTSETTTDSTTVVADTTAVSGNGEVPTDTIK